MFLTLNSYASTLLPKLFKNRTAKNQKKLKQKPKPITLDRLLFRVKRKVCEFVGAFNQQLPILSLPSQEVRPNFTTKLDTEKQHFTKRQQRTMETIETRDGGGGMQPLSRKLGRYHANAAGTERRDSSTTTVDPIAEPPKRPRSLSYSDLPDNNEYIEIVLRGNDTRDDDETRWVSSSSEKSDNDNVEEDEEPSSHAYYDEDVEGEYDWDEEDELLEPPSWDEEDDEDEEEEYDYNNDFDEIDFDDKLDFHQSLLETSSVTSGDDHSSMKRIEMSNMQRYNEILEEDTLRLRRTYQWLENAVQEEIKAISVENSKSIMDNYDLQVQIQVLEEDKQILCEKLQQMEAKVTQLTMESIFHTNRIRELEDEQEKYTKKSR